MPKDNNVKEKQGNFPTGPVSSMAKKIRNINKFIEVHKYKLNPGRLQSKNRVKSNENNEQIKLGNKMINLYEDTNDEDIANENIDNKGIGNMDPEINNTLKSLIEEVKKTSETKDPTFLKEQVQKLRKMLKSNIATPNKTTKEAINFLLENENIERPETTIDDPLSAIGAKNYLWANGYDNLKYIGEGTYNIVFLDEKNNKIIKYCQKKDWRNEDKSADEDAVQKLQEILGNDSTGKMKIYFSEVRPVNNKDIYEADVALGDSIKLKETSLEKHIGKANKTLDTLLANAKSILQAVILLHNAGYSHNDIKPDNIFKIKKLEDDIKKKLDEGKIVEKEVDGKKKYVESDTGKIYHKNMYQLADFGLMSELGKSPKNNLTGYYPKDTGKEKTEKLARTRDVFAVGVTLIELLLAGEHTTDCKEKLGSPDFEDYEKIWTREIRLCKNQKTGLNKIYKNTEKERMIEFLKVIHKMLAPSCETRISDEEALKEIEEIN